MSPWKLKLSNRFKHRYKKLGKELQNRVDEAIRQLVVADEPYSLGVPKQGRWDDYAAWEFGRACRMLFTFDRTASLVSIERVCSHRECNLE